MLESLKAGFLALRYPQLADFFTNVMNFGMALVGNFKYDKAKLEELKQYVEDRFKQLEEVDEENEDEEFRKAVMDVMLKASKLLGKVLKASKYDEEKGMLKLVLEDEEKKKFVIAIMVKVVENG
ncbi:hypothetical protein E3E22_10540 [Thermococcus sp. MV5]|uniref:hypothetical protein n=2 Tax=unclassified Thermococcus TaxID=2627626 RepID=UPI00143A459B|nr:hypothetical protein [Thermococcus sp. MV5]NJE27038.1 hypothetical protein [Thermococcus sp. MV5]